MTLPHDAMIERERAAPGGEVTMEGGAGAYFPGGVYEYRKTFAVPEQHRGKRILVEFEGVYRDAVEYVNGNYAVQRPFGYSHFFIDADRFLRFGQDNEIRVEARTHLDSRWYTGAGIYRDTWMLVGEVVRIGADAVRVTTPDIDAERAVVEVATRVENDSIAIRTVDVVTQIRDAGGHVVASDVSKLTVLPGEPATARQRLYVRGPQLWSTESPALYAAGVTLTDGDGEVDAETVTFGIRSLNLDPEHGLRINGETVKLRGACIHHDNGVLGAATLARAEQRRVRLLKDAGFNAIRMSHNPMSKAMLDACDRLGMLVVDETFDVWTSAKSPFDYSLNFPEWWERDIEAMVAKDYNHPSVILYSIGNEIPETGSPAGAAWGRKLAEKVRTLDGTRYLTNAVNGMLAVLADLGARRQQAQQKTAEAADDGKGINTLMADAGDAIPRPTPTCSPTAATSTSPATAAPRPTTARSSSACAPRPTSPSGARNTTARPLRVRRGRGATPSPPGPGPASKANPSPSRSTATPTRSNCSSTADPSAGDRWAGNTASAPSSTRCTSPANSSPSPTATAPKPAATPCTPRPARCSCALTPTARSSRPTAATSHISPSS